MNGAATEVPTTRLVPPMGGRLVDLQRVPTEAERREANSQAAIRLTPRNLCDLELLATGAFSPLDRFMDARDYRSVLREMRLADGTIFPIPVTLPIDRKAEHSKGTRLALRTAKNELVGTLTVGEVFEADPDEARIVAGTSDVRHPLVAEMGAWSGLRVSGAIEAFPLPRSDGFQSLRLTPDRARTELSRRGRSHVVAFQTRNPIHRAHEWLTKEASRRVDATLLLHPVTGLTKPGDIEAYTRIRCYRALVQQHYDENRTVLALLPLAMRMAGPREALWHALIRRNYGADHFIVGRDHASPGLDSNGKPFYGPYDAQELVAKHSKELGVTMVPFGEVVYLPDENRYEEVQRVTAGTRTLTISGTQVRTEYLLRGKTLPDWFTRPEVSAILRRAFPPQAERGFCVWFTGLPRAGKSTIAEQLTALLVERGRNVTLLDGDVVRTHLSKGLGFSREDRDTNILRIGYVASEIVRHHGVAIVAAITPFAATRSQVRTMVGDEQFLLAYVNTPLAVCEERDTEGLYSRARRGELKGFTGVDDPYEVPGDAALVLDNVNSDADENARRVVVELGRRGFVDG